MKINSQPRDDHQITLEVEVDREQMVGAMHRAARKISERKTIPGFRPGKAPYDVVIRNFGEAAVTEEAVDLLLDEVYPKALADAKIEPATAGSVEKVENLDSTPKFTFTVPLAPTVNLGDYRSIRSEYNWQEPGEEKTQEAIEELRRMYAKTEAVERPIQTGDFVMIDLKGEKTTKVEGETAPIDRPGLPVFIRDTEKEDEFPFKGFSKKLIGLNIDGKITFAHTFKKDHPDEKLKGQKINFDVTIKMIRGSILPDLNDDFAKQVGPFENIQALHDAVKANIATQSRSEYDDNYFTDLIEKIKTMAVIKYPPQVLDHELEHVMEDLKARLDNQGMDMAAYLKSRDMDENKFKDEEAKPIAIKRLERSLIMDELTRTEKIKVDQQMLQTSFEQTWTEYQSDSNIQKTLKGKSQPPKKIMDAVAMESASRAYIQQTLTRLKDIATGQAPVLVPDVVEAVPAKKIKKQTTTSGKKKAKTSAVSE